MSLPLSIKNLFSEKYDCLPASLLRSSSEAHNLEAALRISGCSYRTKINKSKKHGRMFIVMLLGEPSAA
jgi:hypothetical protein